MGWQTEILKPRNGVVRHPTEMKKPPTDPSRYLPGARFCQRRFLRKIRNNTKEQVKTFSELKCLEEATKQELLRPFRHRAIQLGEAKEFRKQVERVLVPSAILAAACGFFLGPLFFAIRATRMGFHFSFKIPSPADGEFLRSVLTIGVFLILAYLPVFATSYIYLVMSTRLRQRIAPLVFTLFGVSVLAWVISLSNILVSSRVATISFERQVIALVLLAFLIYYAGVFAFAFVGASIVYIIDRRMTKTLADAFIMDGLVSVLSEIEKHPMDWVDVEFKRSLILKLEKAATCIGKYLPSRLRTGDIVTDSLSRETASQMAAGIRSFIPWILTPKSDTRGELIARLARLLVYSTRGDWDSFDRIHAEAVSRSELLRARVKPLILAFASGAVPVLLVHLVRYLNLIDPAISKPVLIGTYIWAATTILSQLDPTFGAKLLAVKDLTQWLPFGGKRDK